MLQAAIAAAPGYAEAHNNLGVLQRELGAIQVRHSCIACSGAQGGLHALVCNL